jgi:hypothetical protein
VAVSLPLWAARIPVADEAQPGFMDKGGGLKGLASLFLGHPGGRQVAQFLVDQGKQYVSGLAVALLQYSKNPRHLAHALPGSMPTDPAADKPAVCDPAPNPGSPKEQAAAVEEPTRA